MAHLHFIHTSCQTSPLLLFVTWQQPVTEYCWEGSTSTAIPSTSTSDFVGPHNEIEGIAFGAVLVNFTPERSVSTGCFPAFEWL